MDSEQSNQPLTNAERQKRYRGKMKNDPAFQQKNKSRNAKNYINKKAQNPDEELEKARIRKERSRAKSRIEKKEEVISSSKMVKKVSKLLPNSPNSKLNILKRVGKIHGIQILTSKQSRTSILSDSEQKIIVDF